MSESDVYRRQIVTYKDGPRTERVNSTFYTFALYFAHMCYKNVITKTIAHHGTKDKQKHNDKQ